MSKINGGATLWARQTIDSDIFYNKPDKWFKIWFYLINEVNHKSNKQFARGSCFMKYEWIIKKTKATKNEVDHCVRWLKSATMITTTKATRGFVIKVINYNGYQSLESYKSDTKSDSNGETKAKQKRNKSETKATLLNKNGNNVNNDNNVKKKYNDAVFLTDTEYKKLISELGESLTKELIENLSLYIRSQGKEKKYKSHYATVLAWNRKNRKQGATKDEEHDYPKYKPKKISKGELEENRKRGQKEIAKTLKKLKRLGREGD